MKKALAFILAALMIFALAACGNGARSAVAGTYNGVHSKWVGSDEWDEEEFSVELKADGTGTSNRDGASYDITWDIDGENFTMTETFIGKIEYTGTLKDGELHIYNGEPSDPLTYEYVYKK